MGQDIFDIQYHSIIYQFGENLSTYIVTQQCTITLHASNLLRR